MSSSNGCFFTYIQISQEVGQVVWYSHLFKNFPQFVVIHTGKGFSIVNRAEVDVFLELSCFFDDPMDVGNLISGSSAFSKSSWTSGSSWFTYYRSLAWRILSITLLACERKWKWSRLVVSDSLRPHGQQHASFPVHTIPSLENRLCHRNLHFLQSFAFLYHSFLVIL